jgi:hypothetical protein
VKDVTLVKLQFIKAELVVMMCRTGYVTGVLAQRPKFGGFQQIRYSHFPPEIK